MSGAIARLQRRPAQVIPFPGAACEPARRIIARSDLHSDAAVLDACEHLMRCGDWIDQERARVLHAAIIRGAVSEINRRGRIRRIAGDVLGTACLFALLFMFLTFTPG